MISRESSPIIGKRFNPKLAWRLTDRRETGFDSCARAGDAPAVPPQAAGVFIEARDYGRPDFDRLLVLTERTRRVAARVVELLRDADRYAKVIVFCEDIDHATRMCAALRNAAPAWHAEHGDYFARLTGDVPQVAGLVDRFCDPAERYPVVAVTSELLTTGIDVKTCRYVVIDQVIQSMTEFKQIIGRGTRLLPSHHKLYFTIVEQFRHPPIRQQIALRVLRMLPGDAVGEGMREEVAEGMRRRIHRWLSVAAQSPPPLFRCGVDRRQR